MSLDGLSDRNESIKILASPASMRNGEWPCHVCFIGIVFGNVSLYWKCKLSSQRLARRTNCTHSAMARGDGFLVRLSLSQRPVRHLSKADVNWTTQWRDIDITHSCSKALQSVSALGLGESRWPTDSIWPIRGP